MWMNVKLLNAENLNLKFSTLFNGVTNFGWKIYWADEINFSILFEFFSYIKVKNQTCF
jgi:hypothetical protein